MCAVDFPARCSTDEDEQILGPFPIHAREQHFLSPAYPLDLPTYTDFTAVSSPIPPASDSSYLSSLSPSAQTSWTRTTADSDGRILVSYPSIPWEQMHATEGWAGFQHVSVLRGWLTVYPPSTSQTADTCAESGGGGDPFLCTSLVQGAFFTVLPPSASLERKAHVPEWHTGNVYAMSRAPAQLVKLPVSPERSKDGTGTRYEVVICGAYEIRLFGDPHAHASKYPILDISFSVCLEFPSSSLDPFSPPSCTSSSGNSACHGLPLQHSATHTIAPHIVDGRPFGEAIGIGITSIDFGAHRWWTVTNARLVGVVSGSLNSSLVVSLVEPIRIAPTQTRIVPLHITLTDTEYIPESVTELTIELTFSLAASSTTSSKAGLLPNIDKFELEVAIPLVHVPLWTQTTCEPVRATYFFARSMVSTFTAIPPRLPCMESESRKAGQDGGRVGRGNEPILALHGAGVDILTTSFWADSLPRQKHAWVIIPMGRTEWVSSLACDDHLWPQGLDWHGPSSADAFLTVTALSHILSGSRERRSWGFDPDTRVVLMGHSNGGQGAWYMAARWPDRVCGVVPAAGYIKSQAFSHFIDPFLRAVLETSLTPDDNDLFLSNLVGTPILAVHGGEDDNVPPWHTRELVGVLKTWDPDADVSYYEHPGRPHWYPEVLKNDCVQAFLNKIYSSSSSGSSQLRRFTLTVAVPQESGSMYGWQVHALSIPGLLARLEVTPARSTSRTSIQTTNVSVFSLDVKAWFDACDYRNTLLIEDPEFDNTSEIRWSVISVLEIDGDEIALEIGDHKFTEVERTVWFTRDTTSSQGGTTWKKLIPCQPHQRLQAILSTPAPLTLLVPSLARSSELSAALRIVFALRLFHALDARIVAAHELTSLADVGDGNLVTIGCAREPLVQSWLEQVGSTWKFDNDAWYFGGRRFIRPSSAILFLQPHPTNRKAISLFLQYTDLDGLESAVQLFPIRTGVLSPDWIVVNGRAGKIGAAGVEGAGVFGCSAAGSWVWNHRLSWLD
ncbi:hypothetical protein J3A83DRAFT_4436701 [Scleroderma citrinum]